MILPTIEYLLADNVLPKWLIIVICILIFVVTTVIAAFFSYKTKRRQLQEKFSEEDAVEKEQKGE